MEISDVLMIFSESSVSLWYLSEMEQGARPWIFVALATWVSRDLHRLPCGVERPQSVNRNSPLRSALEVLPHQLSNVFVARERLHGCCILLASCVPGHGYQLIWQL